MHVKDGPQRIPAYQFRSFPGRSKDSVDRLEEGHVESSDARDKIRRRYDDLETYKTERTLRDYQQQQNILRFQAYIHQRNGFDQNEPDHVREIIIWYYVGDQTVRMFEKTCTNSGFQKVC